jgi:NAD(P)-dependent dehydrogenase (short-subunit alcohol dehydrogenase family)
MTGELREAPALPDVAGKTIVVTGGSSGIGAATAAAFSRAGAHVVLAVRDVAKGERVAAGLAGRTEVRRLDLADLSSVRSFAAPWSGDLHVLINNAGIMNSPRGRTADGFELQMGTNHLGPFALTNLLLPHIVERVVTVTSFYHDKGRIDLGDLNADRRRYRPAQAYNDSKLANLLFALELQRRLGAARSPVRSYAVNPGLVDSGLLSHSRGFQHWALRYLGQTTEEGAQSTLYAATADLPGGSYVGPEGFRHFRGRPAIERPAAVALDPGTARQLWDLSAQLTGL